MEIKMSFNPTTLWTWYRFFYEGLMVHQVEISDREMILNPHKINRIQSRLRREYDEFFEKWGDQYDH